MELVSLFTFTLLLCAGGVHFYWALGGRAGLNQALPTKAGKRLIDPTRGMTFLVGAVLLGFAYAAYALHFQNAKSSTLLYAGWGIAALFFLRAIGDFNAVGFFKRIRSTTFATYDTLLFSPLCLLLGTLFALLSANA